MSCITLSKSITPNCEALKRPGGVGKRVFLGSVLDISALTFNTTNTHDLEAIAMKTGKQLVQVVGRPAKSSATTTFEDGENFSLRNQQVNVIAYARTAAERQALEDIIEQDQMFAVVERNDGQFEVYGISLLNYSNWGLKVTGGSYNTGVELNDETGVTLELTGGFKNMPLVFDETETYANNVAALVALLTPAA
jgi:hypothetical protein